MAGTALHAQRPINVPRLALPSPGTSAAGEDIDTPAFRREINVALGRSHSQRTPRRDVIFNVKHDRMVEIQKVPLAMGSSSARMTTLSGGCDHESENTFSSPRSHWVTSTQSTAPAFSPPSRNEPKGRWYEQADKVFRFFGYIIDQVEPTTRQAPANVRLVIIHYYPQDSTLEMLESKETALPGVSRSFALRRPSRVSLDEIRVGSSVLINGTRVHVYDADGFTRRSIPGLRPPERPPAVDKTFSITPRRAPPPTSQNPAAMSAPHNSPGRLNGDGGGGTGSISTMEAWLPWDGGDSSVLSEDAPGFLRMYIRWDESGSDGADPTVHRYILHFFLEDGTVEMRELADIKGGNYFEGRFPVMIRRQKVFKGGGSPSLSVDRIGGDRADTGSLTPRSARINGTGTSGSVGNMSFGDGGGSNDADDDVGQPLTPLDLTVGNQVLLMKRPMTVCGWDETAHVWWERLTGTDMRGLQGDLEDFQRCVRASQSQPRPPSKPKSSFYEGPPQRSGTLRERFFKASENSGKTLRFLARATQDTKTTSTRDNVFIIRFYPEDDALSVYTTHNLGSNAGGLFKGVYLARTCNTINKDTGQPFKARDFHVGSIAKLPSVSLEIVDVDDFSRRYLAQETPLSDCKWQTAPLWAKLFSLATSGGTGTGGQEEVLASTATAGGDNRDGLMLPCSPGKNVTFTGGDGSSGDAAYLRSDSRTFEGLSRDNNSAFDMLSAAAPFPQNANNHSGGGSGARSSVVFARLWAECIGDDTCAAFASNDGAAPGGTDGKTCTRGGPETAPPSQQYTAPSLSNPRNLGPWKRLVAVLRDERGIDVSRALTSHEQILLEREVADWVHRAQGRKEREPGKGMAERLASAAAAALRQEKTKPAAASERAGGSRAGEPAAKAVSAGKAAVGESGSGGIPNVGRRRLSVGGFEFPAVVVEGSASPVGGSPDTGMATKRAGSRGPLATAGDAGEGMGAGSATGGSKKTPERQLDLRGVALDAHEMPASGRDDMFVQRALVRVLAHVFGHGGEAAVLRALKAEGKTPGDAADLWTMCRLLKIVAELSRRETEGLWLKFMPAAVAKAGEGGRVTFAGFLESIKAFEACLRRGEVLGLSSIGRNDNCAGPLVVERSQTKHARRRV